MNTHPSPLRPRRRLRKAAAVAAAASVAASILLVTPAAQANLPADPPSSTMPASTPGFPLPTVHTQQAYDPAADFTSKWTRADAKQIMAQSNPNVAPGQNSMSPNVTMPEIPKDFPAMNDDVWVWDTWSLTDENANQISYKAGTSSSLWSLTATPVTVSTSATGTHGSVTSSARPTPTPPRTSGTTADTCSWTTRPSATRNGRAPRA